MPVIAGQRSHRDPDRLAPAAPASEPWHQRSFQRGMARAEALAERSEIQHGRMPALATLAMRGQLVSVIDKLSNGVYDDRGGHEHAWSRCPVR